MLVVLALTACRCTAFSSMEIVDRSEEQDPDLPGFLRGEIDAFASDTTLTGVCVDRVVVEDDLWWRKHDIWGYFNSVNRTVHVEPSYSTDLIRHELCHALDWVYDGISEEHADLFDTSGIDPDLYRTPDARTREAFARACENGLPDFQVALALAEVCPEPPDNLAVSEFPWEEVYPGAPAPEPLEIEVGRSLHDPWEVDDAPVVIEEVVRSGSDHIALLGTWLAEGAGEVVVFVDPVARAVKGRIELPDLGQSDLTLVQTEGAPWLLYHFEDQASVAIEIRPDARTRRIELPELMVSWSQTARVVHDELWIFDFNGLPWGWMLRVDLQTGEVDADPFGWALEDHATYSYPVATPEGLWLTARRADQVHILVNAHTGATLPNPLGESSPHYALLDETWLLDGQRHTDTPLGRHLEDGRLLYDEESCDSQRWPKGQPVHVAGSLWMVDQPIWDRPFVVSRVEASD